MNEQDREDLKYIRNRLDFISGVSFILFAMVLVLVLHVYLSR